MHITAQAKAQECRLQSLAEESKQSEHAEENSCVELAQLHEELQQREKLRSDSNIIADLHRAIATHQIQLKHTREEKLGSARSRKRLSVVGANRKRASANWAFARAAETECNKLHWTPIDAEKLFEHWMKNMKPVSAMSPLRSLKSKVQSRKH